MKKYITSLFLLVLLVSIKSDASEGALISGEWNGCYFYSNQNAQPVQFSGVLYDNDGAIEGVFFEVNTFRREAPSLLKSHFFGTREDNQVTFRKTYRTRNVEHFVDYKGAVDSSLKVIRGTWSVETANGRFIMMRDKYPC